MYEEIVKEMQTLDENLKKGKIEVNKTLLVDEEREENAKINEELKKSNINTIDFEQLQKITGVKHGKRSKK